MGRLDRVKDALASTIKKLSTSIEESHKTGKIPSDYSLGFANGAIFFQHHLEQRSGGPKFFDRTMSIGVLPMPIALRAPGEVENEFNMVAQLARKQEQIFLQDQIIVQARGVIEAFNAMESEEEPEKHTIDAFSKSLVAVKKAIEEFDQVMTNHEEAQHAEKNRTAAIKEATQSEPTSISSSPGKGPSESPQVSP